MGMNFYLKVDHGAEVLHIGKSSVGWEFALRVYPERGITDLETWIPHLLQHEIVDEGGMTVFFDELMRKIVLRSWKRPLKTELIEIENDPYVEVGHNNLFRLTTKDPAVVGYGKGPYYYMVRDFS